MRSFVAGLALVVALTVAMPAVAQSPSPGPPCQTGGSVPLFAPALVGLTPAAADAIAATVGLSVLYQDEESAAEPGTIVSQDTAPGAVVTGNQVVAGVAVAPAPTATPKPTRAPVDLTRIPFARLRSMARAPAYRDFFRNAEAFVGKLVTFKGRVLQVVPGEGKAADVLVNVTRDRFGFWDDTVWVYYTGKRLLVDDIVEIVGRGEPPVTYESAGAGTQTVPAVTEIQTRIVQS